MEYVYRSPSDDGYIEQKVSRSEKKELLKKFGIHTPSCLVTLAKFKKEETGDVTVEVLSSKLAIVLNLLLIPVAVVFYGVSNWKKIFLGAKKILNERKYGAYVAHSYREDPAVSPNTER